MPQTLSTTRLLSQFRPSAAASPLSTPDPSQVKTSGAVTSQSWTHKWVMTLPIYTDLIYITLHSLTHYRPSMYVCYLPPPPLSHAPYSGTLPLPPFLFIGFQFHSLGWMVRIHHMFWSICIEFPLHFRCSCFDTRLRFSLWLILGQFRHPALSIGHPPLLLLSLASLTCDH